MRAKRLIVLILSLYVAASGGISLYYWLQHEHYVKTDNARTNVDVALLKAPAAGSIIELDVRENQQVRANEVIGYMQAGPVSSTPGARIPLLAPKSGYVLRVGVNEREVVTAGQPLAAVADLGSAYVEAHLMEKEASRVRVGQTVDVYLDTYGGQAFKGIVSRMENVTVKETWPIVSLVSSKEPREEQLVSVRIQVPDTPLVPGTGAEVAIHVRGESDGVF